MAELPDKTMIATLIMGSRYRPLLVWLGRHGGLRHPRRRRRGRRPAAPAPPPPWIEGSPPLLFAAGAAYLLFVPEKEEEAEGEEEADSARKGLKTVGAAFLVIFIGEFGDLTQILTANLAAKYHAPAEVFIGAFAGLATVAALGAFGGRALLRVLPLAVIRKAGGVLLAGFAVYTLVTLVRG